MNEIPRFLLTICILIYYYFFQNKKQKIPYWVTPSTKLKLLKVVEFVYHYYSFLKRRTQFSFSFFFLKKETKFSR